MNAGSTNIKDSIDSLLVQSTEILSGQNSSEETVQLLEKYVDSFATWLRDQDGQIKVSNKEDVRLLKKLADQHSQVLSLANDSKSQLVDALKQLEVRGKAILAYLDQGSERISQGPFKKG